MRQSIEVLTLMVENGGSALNAHRFIKFNAGAAAYADAAGAVFGVSLTDADANEAFTVVRSGTAVVDVDGTGFSAGDEIEVGSSGVATAFSAGTKVGMALEDGTANGKAEILLYANAAA